MAALCSECNKKLRGMKRSSKYRKAKKDPVTSTLRVTAPKSHFHCIKYLLDQGADINASHADWGTALQNAVHNGKTELVQFLLDKGAKEEGRCVCHQDLCTCAVANGHEEILNYLIARQDGSYFSDSVDTAAEDGNLGRLKLLIDAGAAVGHGSAVYFAVVNEHIDCVKALVEAGASVDQSSLEDAIETNDGNMVKLLVDYGAQITERLGSYETALECASDQEADQCIQHLLDAGATVTPTALEYAVFHKNLNLLKLLIDSGADVDKSQALAEAVRWEDFDAVELLIEAGADVNQSDALGDAQSERMAQLLIEAGADVKESRALKHAAGRGEIKLMELLLEKGADVNEDTPLMAAAANGQDKCVEFLIKAGAEVNSSALQRTLSDIIFPLGRDISRFSFTRCIELLAGAGADVTKCLCEEDTLFFMDFKHESLALLIELGADVNAIGSNGNPILLEALMGGYQEMASILVKAGADVNVTDTKGLTALDYAMQKNNEELVAQILEAGHPFKLDHFNVLIETGSLKVAALLLKTGAPVNVPWREELNRSALPRSKAGHALLSAAGEIMDMAEIRPQELLDLDRVQAKKFLAKCGANYRKFLEHETCMNIPLDMILTGLKLSATPVVSCSELGQTPDNPTTFDDSATNGELHTSAISEDQTYLIRAEISLKHICRKRIRKELILRHWVGDRQNLFTLVPNLGLPPPLTKYLLYNISLDEADLVVVMVKQHEERIKEELGRTGGAELVKWLENDESEIYYF